MTVTANVFYFGDQSVEPFVSLVDLVREIPNSALLGTFLRSCFDALDSAVGLLPPKDKNLFRGRDFAQLVDHVRTNEIRHAAVSSVLSCVAQLGWLVIHRERNAEAWLHKERTVVGICTGNLAALAAVVASSDSDILRLGPVMIPISLRLGIEVSRRSHTLEASSESWSVGVSGISPETVKDELRQFNNSRLLPDLKHVYISAHSASSVTISGPPTLLSEFVSSEALRATRKLPLPIYGAYHAQRLPLPNLDYIMGESPLLERLILSSGSLLHPKATRAQSFRELLRLALQEILQRPLDIDDVIQNISRRTEGCDVRLTSIGPARMSSLERALQPGHVCRLGSRQLQSPQSSLVPLDTSEAIAVVGMAGRFPGAENVDELWKLLVEGKDQHRLIPIDRFDVRTHVDPAGKVRNASLTPYGCFYDGVGDFDIALFKMSPREAAQTDPMQRLMLLTAYEALESAGYYDTGDSDSRPKNGTFYGVAGDDYRQVNSSQDVDINYITGGTRAFGPGRVSYYFGWEGPSMSVDTACSASAVAMHQAIMSLKLGHCDVALSGGANLLTCSDMFAGLSRARFVNKTGPCKTFDETADGYCRADGFATVVFKRYGDATRDKDNILGVIRSVDTYHAGTAISLTHPEANIQTALFQSVLSSAGMTVDDVDHIELHGTGTQAGDLAESESVAGLLDQPRLKDRPLTISSVKPNVGHSEAASGVTSLIKGLLMFQHQTIPRHIGIKTRINPKLPAFGELGVVVPQENMPYPVLTKDGKRRMLVNNFNATGGITAMLLEEFNDSPFTSTDIRTHHPIAVSAATATALNSSLSRLLEHLQANPAMNLSHLSYTLTARRLHHKYRFACVVESRDELIRRLEAQLATSKARDGEQPFSIFVFTGQTSALPRAKTLFDTNATFRDHILHSNQMCHEMGLPSFIDVIAGEEDGGFTSVQLQLALVALEIALASLFQSWGIHPKAVIGHSLGEYAAFCICNVMSLADTLWLVGKRGLLLESTLKNNEYSMAVAAFSSADAVKSLQTFSSCAIACCNSPQQTVISGKEPDIDSLLAHLKTVNIKATKLHTLYGFHSQQMDNILENYRQVAQGVSFAKPVVPFVSTLLSETVKDEGVLCADYLCRQTREPVRFEDGLRKIDTLLESGQKTFWIELGPTPACIPMIASTLQAKPAALAAGLDPKKPNWATIGNVLSMYYISNGTIRWDEYHKEHLDSLQLLQLPSYPFDLQRYWIQYDGDWMIRKNQKLVCEDAEAPPRVTLESSTLHRVESDSTEKGVRKITFSTDLTSGELKDTLHTKVGRAAEVSNSIFADMAMAAALYLCKRSGEARTAVGVFDLEMPLGYALAGISSLRTVAMQHPTDTNNVQISIAASTFGEKMELARCRVAISDGEDWTLEANINAYLYQSRMDLLQFLMANGQATRLMRSDMHQLVTYDDVSTGIEEAILSTSVLEAVGKLHVPLSTGKYVYNPRQLEALMQLAAILLNYSRRGQHICCGWSRMILLMPMEAGKIYRAHIRMQPHGRSGTMVGDIHVLDMAGFAVTVIKHLVFCPDPMDAKATAPVRRASNAHKALDTSNLQDHGAGFVAESPKRLDPQALAPFQEEATSSSATTCTADSHEINAGTGASSTPTSPAMSSPGPGGPKNRQPPDSSAKSVINFETIIGILAAELGVESQSLTDDVILQDLGVDSIIEISVVARLQEYMSKPLPPAFLVEYDSVAKLRAFFGSEVYLN